VIHKLLKYSFGTTNILPSKNILIRFIMTAFKEHKWNSCFSGKKFPIAKQKKGCLGCSTVPSFWAQKQCLQQAKNLTDSRTN